MEKSRTAERTFYILDVYAVENKNFDASRSNNVPWQNEAMREENG